MKNMKMTSKLENQPVLAKIYRCVSEAENLCKYASWIKDHFPKVSAPGGYRRSAMRILIVQTFIVPL